MTQDEQEPFDFNNMFDRLKSMVWKNCTECGQEFHGLPEADLCLECRYNQEHPEESDMYWTWNKGGRPTWGIVAYWPDGQPLPDAGDRVTVHRKDGSTSVVKIHEVEGLRYLPTGRAQLRCMID